MFKFCPNVDQGIVIPIHKFKKAGSFVTPIALALLPSFDNCSRLLVFSEPVTYSYITNVPVT